MIKEFRDFIIKGNALDLAIGVIIGAAFGAVINSIVTDLIGPIIGLLTGGINLAGQGITVPTPMGEVFFATGNFFQALINLIIIGFVLFLIVRAANRLNPPPAPPPAGPTTDEKILAVLEKLDKKL
ncbi:MAG: large conductance mechanosensitive channel protein MscL [Chloroflexota bacterium]|nr:large conductance mechanosensitive channel protein MscL [Chloroflexota bacterium]